MLPTVIMARTRSKPPWEQAAPRSKLSPRAKGKAPAAASRAARRYPNLDDSMRPAAESHGDRRLPVTRARRPIARSR
jgi:hypothetical protein